MEKVFIRGEAFKVDYASSLTCNDVNVDVSEWENFIDLLSIDGQNPHDLDPDDYDAIGRNIFESEQAGWIKPEIQDC